MSLIPSIISTVAHIYFQILGSIALAMAIICCHSIKSTVLSIFLRMHEYIYASTVCNGSHKSSVKFLQKPLNVILFGIRPLYAKARNEEKKSMYQYQKRITTASQGKYCHNCQQDFNLMGPKSFGRHLSQCISRPIPIHNTSLKNFIQKQHESETYQYQKRANKINSLFRRETIEETANK